VDLYGIQQELARNQMSVEQLHDEFAKRQKERIQGEQELREIREAYTEKHKLIKMERKKGESVLPPGRRCRCCCFNYLQHVRNDSQLVIIIVHHPGWGLPVEKDRESRFLR